MGYPETFEGFMITDHKKWSDFKKQEFTPKPFGDYDVDIKIDFCGVCGSDVHTITGGWGDAKLPVCVGHEIIGQAIRVGDKVTLVKKGDRVGVGAQVWACLECRICKAKHENYCPHQVDTYNAPYPDGSMAYGGYASHTRVHEYFVFRIPDNIDSAIAAPMLCAGLTSYAPLDDAGVGPGKKVAIVGIGGLGHFAVMWAKAMGAEVYVISHSPDKEDDAYKLGAKQFISSQEENWAKPWSMTFDFILNCADMTNEFDMSEYLGTLNVFGKFHNVGLPDEPLPKMQAQDMMPNGCMIGTSHIGNRQQCEAMLKLASEKGIKTWMEPIEISEAGCKEAVERVKENKVHYRFTLTNFDKAFGPRQTV